MKVSRAYERIVRKGSPDNFTGNVLIEQLVWAENPSRVTASVVTFEPRARTAWHTHPLGQLLIVIHGYGVVQRWGWRAELIRAGDIVWIDPGEKHWHGATDTSPLIHIAIQEALEGKTAEWMEHVSEEQYEEALKQARAFIGHT